MVVLTSEWPRSSCTVRMSWLSSRRWVAKEWRNVWQLTRLGMAARQGGSANRALEDGFVEVMAAPLAGLAIDVAARGRKQPLPRPLAPRVRIFSGQSVGQFDPAGSSLEVQPMLGSDGIQVLQKLRLDGSGHHGAAILVAFAGANDDLVAGSVQVRNAQPGALEEAESGAIEEEAHEPNHSLHVTEDGADFLTGQHDGQVLRTLHIDEVIEPRELLAKDLAVEKQERAQGLILRRCRHLAFDSQGIQEAGDFRSRHFGGMALAVEEEVAADPRNVGLLRPAAVVAGPNTLAHEVEEARLRSDDWPSLAH